MNQLYLLLLIIIIHLMRSCFDYSYVIPHFFSLQSLILLYLLLLIIIRLSFCFLMAFLSSRFNKIDLGLVSYMYKNIDMPFDSTNLPCPFIYQFYNYFGILYFCFENYNQLLFGDKSLISLFDLSITYSSQEAFPLTNFDLNRIPQVKLLARYNLLLSLQSSHFQIAQS